MPTRSFTCEENGQKRFWDVSWDGPEVEITSGRWGTAGRARTMLFDSSATRDAYVAAEVRKAQKKGFRETSETAPAPEPKAAQRSKRVDAILAGIRRLALPVWLPRIEPGERAGAIGLVRGGMTLAEEESWPGCPSCGEPLSPLVEIDLSRVPSSPLREDALLQVFWCEAWERGNGPPCTAESGRLARRHARSGVRRHHPSAVGVTPPSSIVGFDAAEEVPRRDENIDEALEALDDDAIGDLLRAAAAAPGDADAMERWQIYDAVATGLGLRARNVTKLGGHPTFVQEYERAFERQLLQIEEGHPFDVNFGDRGAGHVLVERGGRLAFWWSCH